MIAKKQVRANISVQGKVGEIQVEGGGNASRIS